MASVSMPLFSDILENLHYFTYLLTYRTYLLHCICQEGVVITADQRRVTGRGNGGTVIDKTASKMAQINKHM